MKFLNLIDGANKLMQDTSHRLVSDSEKESWSGKANSIHEHTVSDIVDFPTTMKADGGSADTAKRLETPRVITLTGDVSGSFTFDGSIDVSFTTEVADDSHNHIIDNIDGLQDELNKRAFERISVKKITASYSISLKDNMLLIDSSSSDIVLTLPEASLAAGKVYKVKKINDPNLIVINSDSRETIDGELSYIIEYKYQSIELVCDGSQWFVM